MGNFRKSVLTTKSLKSAVGSRRTFAGEWKDLGTWNTLTDELSEHTMGNVVMDEESEIPTSSTNLDCQSCALAHGI